MDARSLLYCLSGVLCWGMAPVLYRFVGSNMAPQKMQAVRSVGFFLSALAVLCLAPGGDFWPGPLPLAVLMICTVMDLGVGDTLYFLCVTRVGAGRASALTNTYPLYVVLFSWLILGEGLSSLALLGVLAVVAGLLPGILAGLCWSSGQVMMRWIYAHTAMGASALMFWRSAALLIYAWAVFLPWRRRSGDAAPFLPLRSSGGLIMLASGALILTLPGWLVALALKSIPASAVAPVTGASPAVAALLGRLLYRETITPFQWLGILMIISGGAVVNLF